MIQDLLLLASADARRLRLDSQPFDLANPVASSLDDLQTLGGDRLVIEHDIQSPLEVRADPAHVAMVVQNLIENAAKYTPAGGTVRIAAGPVGAMVRFSVANTGPALPEADREGIFERFYSERPHGEQFGQHSGLGLSISRQIVEGLHGRISAENMRDAEGKVTGARFIVRLPGA